MREAPGSLQLEETEAPAPELVLLIAPEPWLQNFSQNFGALFRRSETRALRLESTPAAFWPDVFVDRGLPWPRFLQSGAYHILALALIWAASRFLALQPHPTGQPTFTKADVVYYTPSEYLPPLDTRRPDSPRARKADPEYSAQPIISVPREADNRSQTLFTHKDVTPPDIPLQHDVALPNTVAWSGKPQLPIGPVPAVPPSEITRLAPRMERSVIAPPPPGEAATRETLRAPPPPVLPPPPSVQAGATRRLRALNIGRTALIAPAPPPSLHAQRALPRRDPAVLSGRAPQGIAPPPAPGQAGRSHSS